MNMKQGFALPFFVLIQMNAFSQDKSLDAIVRKISIGTIGVENFGFNGVDQHDMFGDLIPREWHRIKVSSDAKYYNFNIDQQFNIGDSDSRLNGRFQVVTLGNQQRDVTLAIVVRYIPDSEDQSHRFLIKLKPGDDITLNFLSLQAGSVEFYCMAPFKWTAYNYVTGAVTGRDPIMASRFAPDPGNACTEATISQRGLCFNFRVSDPHCIRIVGEYDGGIALASMHWFFECPDSADEPMYQYVQVFYPTRDELFHKAIGTAVPPCNPDLTTPEERNDYLSNDNYCFTQNVSDATRKHKWDAVHNVAWLTTQERVDCVGTASCEGGFLYQIHGFCE